MNDVNKLYRIMQHTVVDVLSEACGIESHKWIRLAGQSAGTRFAEEHLDLSVKLFAYIRQLQRLFKDLDIGTLRIERASSKKAEFILDCSSHSTYSYTICCYGEGLLAGMLDAYIGKANKPILSDYTIQLAL